MAPGTHILLVIGGGIAAYKSLDLIRQIRRAGGVVTPVLTRAGAEFVTPLSVSSLAERKVFSDLWDLTDEAEMGHIQLSRVADLIVVAPATADLMAKMAQGRADDLASTLLLATDTPVLIAPAMNVRMWEHPATQRNLATLKADGITVVGPEVGDMACGEYGAGRMSEPDEILASVFRRFSVGVPSGKQILSGKRILVTSGPTHEPIDPVRYIANRSSGAQGAAIGRAAREAGAHVVFVTGPASVPPPPGVELVRVETAEEMKRAVEAALPVDAAIFAAAVADWRIAERSGRKMKKRAGSGPPQLELAENPDILAGIAGRGEDRPRLVVGFAAETHDVLENATAKRARKGCDWIVANDVSEGTAIMGGAENAVTLVTADGHEDWPRAGKDEVARKLVRRIAEALA